MSKTHDWPIIAIGHDDNSRAAGDRWDMFKAYPNPNVAESLYLREDAARAWCGLAMWCMCEEAGANARSRRFLKGFYKFLANFD